MSKHQKQPAQHTGTGPSFFASLSPTMQDVVSVVALYLVTLVMFRAIVFEGAAFQAGGDTANAHSYYTVGKAIEKEEGVDVLWMPYFFSGMPTFGNVAFVPRNVNYLQTGLNWVLNWFFLRQQWTWLVVHYFIGAVCMFFLLRVLGMGRLISLFGALTFLLSPYGVGLAGEGHGSKLMALNYLPAVFLLTHLLFERRTVLVFGLLGTAVGTLMLTNHLQIVYYVLMVVGLYLLFQILTDARSAPGRAAWKTALFVGGIAVGFAIASYIYLSVYEYSHFSIRGGGTAGASGGLTYEYATGWSWHPLELITLLIPGFFGMKADLYWGSMQPWTNSSVYAGLLPLVLSVVALVKRRTATVVFLGILTLLVVVLSMGNNFPLLYDLCFSYLPFFNKFRAPAMILHLLPFLLGTLGAIGLTYVLETQEQAAGRAGEQLRKVLLYTTIGLVVALILILVARQGLFSSVAGSLLRDEELQQVRQQYGARMDQIIPQIPQVQKRFDLLWKDTIKFLLIAAISVGVYLGFIRRKISASTFTLLALAIVTIDLAIVAGKYIDPRPAKSLEQNFAPDATTTFLQRQPGLFRVFPLGQQLFMDNTLPFHRIQSIGGYSPAKLKIYQTLLDSCMYQGSDPALPLNMAVVNMLNVEYLAVQGRLPDDRFELVNADEAKRMLIYRNAAALPRAWYAGEAVVKSTDREVFRALNDPAFDPGQTAVLMEPVAAFQAPDSGRRPNILTYRSREILLETDAPQPALLVLSEVYYPAGWKAYVDGQEVPIHRTNYILRSVVIPGGKHQVAFRFEPAMYQLGFVLSSIGWAVALLCILVGLIPVIRQRRGGQG